MSTIQARIQKGNELVEEAHELINRQRVSRQPEIPNYLLLRHVNNHKKLLGSAMIKDAAIRALESDKNGILAAKFRRLNLRLRGQ